MAIGNGLAVFSISSTTTNSVTIKLTATATVSILIRIKNDTHSGGQTGSQYGELYTVADYGTYYLPFSGLPSGQTLYAHCFVGGQYVGYLTFATSAGGGTSGGGSASGSWSGGSKTKTNSVSWTESTAANTSFANTNGSYSSYGTQSLISSDSTWYGYSWVWAKLISVTNGDVDITYKIQIGCRTKNIADWPYHGMTVKYTDADNTEQTYLNLPATSTGNYWANASSVGSSYDYQVLTPFTFTLELTYRKSISAAYSRKITVRFYNDHSYWCYLGGMYQWENILNINLNIPKRTKYIASVDYGNGGVATVNSASEVYVNSGTTVSYVATPNAGCTFLGWYLPTNVNVDEFYGYVAATGVSPVSSSPTYSKSITADYELIAIFSGYKAPASWKGGGRVYVKVSGTWVLAQPYVRNGTTWTLAGAYVG